MNGSDATIEIRWSDALEKIYPDLEIRICLNICLHGWKRCWKGFFCSNPWDIFRLKCDIRSVPPNFLMLSFFPLEQGPWEGFVLGCQGKLGFCAHFQRQDLWGSPQNGQLLLSTLGNLSNSAAFSVVPKQKLWKRKTFWHEKACLCIHELGRKWFKALPLRFNPRPLEMIMYARRLRKVSLCVWETHLTLF